jgi:hypothetical protein
VASSAHGSEARTYEETSTLQTTSSMLITSHGLPSSCKVRVTGVGSGQKRPGTTREHRQDAWFPSTEIQPRSASDAYVLPDLRSEMKWMAEEGCRSRLEKLPT